MLRGEDFLKGLIVQWNAGKAVGCVEHGLKR